MPHGLLPSELQARLDVLAASDRRLERRRARTALRWGRWVMLNVVMVLVVLCAAIRFMHWDVALGWSLVAPKGIMTLSLLLCVVAVLAGAATPPSSASFWWRCMPYGARARLEQACALERSQRCVDRQALLDVQDHYRGKLPLEDPNMWGFGELHHALHGQPQGLAKDEGCCHAMVMAGVGLALHYHIDGDEASWPDPAVVKAWLDAQGPDTLARLHDSKVHPWQRTLNVVNAWSRSERPSEVHEVVVQEGLAQDAFLDRCFNTLLAMMQAHRTRLGDHDVPSEASSTLRWGLDAWFGLVLLHTPPGEALTLEDDVLSRYQQMWACWRNEPAVSLMAAKADHKGWVATFSVRRHRPELWEAFWRTCREDMTWLYCGFSLRLSDHPVWHDVPEDRVPVNFRDFLELRVAQWSNRSRSPDRAKCYVKFNLFPWVIYAEDERQGRRRFHRSDASLELFEREGLQAYGQWTVGRIATQYREIQAEARTFPRPQRQTYLVWLHWCLLMSIMAECDVVSALEKSVREQTELAGHFEPVLTAYRECEERHLRLLVQQCPNPDDATSVQRTLGALASRTVVLPVAGPRWWVPRTQRWLERLRDATKQRMSPHLLRYHVASHGRLPPSWSLEACWRLSVQQLGWLVLLWVHRMGGGVCCVRVF